MKILGIDPGSTRIGFGLIEFKEFNRGTTRNGRGLTRKDNTITLLKSGLLKISSKDKNSRLLDLAESFEKLLKKEKPDLAAIEKLFFMKNIKTGMEVSESRGILKLITLRNKIELIEIAPTEVKLNITGYGNADKKAVAKMVCRILKTDKIKGPDDVFDAIAIAIVASFQRRALFGVAGN